MTEWLTSILETAGIAVIASGVGVLVAEWSLGWGLVSSGTVLVVASFVAMRPWSKAAA